MKIGTKTADKIEDLGRAGLKKIQQWAEDDPNTWTDDALRLAGGGLKNVGKVANLPGIRHGLRIMDAPFHYGSKLAGKAAGAAGIDPRFGEWTVRGLEAATGVGLGKKALKKSGKIAQASLSDAGSLMIRQHPLFRTGAGGLGGPGGQLAQELGITKTKQVLDKVQNRLKIQQLEGLGPIKPDKDGFFHITKKQMPQMKGQLEEWLRKEYKAKGRAAHIKRKEFGTIVVDGDEREIIRITEFLERDGKLPFPVKVVNTKQAKFRRLQRERPPKAELDQLGKSYGLSEADMIEYYEDAVSGFASVREAARREGLSFRQIYKEAQTGKKTPKTEYTPGGTHAGHYQAAEKGGATTGRGAGLEPGKANVSKGSKFEGNVNVYAAELAGIPTTWAQDFKMWFAQKKGLPHRDFHAEFTNAQREKILSIPWTATRSEVEAFFKKHKLDPSLNPNLRQIKDIQRDFKGL